MQPYKPPQWEDTPTGAQDNSLTQLGLALESHICAPKQTARQLADHLTSAAKPLGTVYKIEADAWAPISKLVLRLRGESFLAPNLGSHGTLPDFPETLTLAPAVQHQGGIWSSYRKQSEVAGESALPLVAVI